jgi:hypothetical protein
LLGYLPSNAELMQSKICKISAPLEPPTLYAIKPGRPNRSDIDVTLVAAKVKLSFFSAEPFSAADSEAMPLSVQMFCLWPTLGRAIRASSSVSRFRNYTIVRKAIDERQNRHGDG